MGEKIKTTLWLLGYALAAGLLLALFSMLASIVKYVFSLLALYVGIRFFRRFDSIGFRIGFFALAIVFYFLIVIITQAVIFLQSNSPAAL
jgi:hypothetical protein